MKERAEHKAGLTFSVSTIENILQNELKTNNKNYNLTRRLSIPVTAIIEYLTAELLELSGNTARDNKKVRIKIEHIITAIKNDEELKAVFNTDSTVIAEDIPKLHTWIFKILKQVHPDTSINADASRFVDKLLFDFIKLMATKYPAERKLINIDDIIKESLPGELAKHASTEATKASIKYKQASTNDLQVYKESS